MFNRHAGLAALYLFAAVSAHAHVPFLKPSQFNVENPRLHVESAFTEYPFQADFAMDSPNFALTAPAGLGNAVIHGLQALVYLFKQQLAGLGELDAPINTVE